MLSCTEVNFPFFEPSGRKVNHSQSTRPKTVATSSGEFTMNLAYILPIVGRFGSMYDHVDG